MLCTHERLTARDPIKEWSWEIEAEDTAVGRGFKVGWANCVADMGTGAFSAALAVRLISNRLDRFGGAHGSSNFRACLASLSLSFSSSTVVEGPSTMALGTKTRCWRL
jgi:hypothetical protein